MNDYCERCGKRVPEIHTCSPNPVIERLRAQLANQAERIKELEELLRHDHPPNTYRIQISFGDYHFLKKVSVSERVFIGEIASAMVDQIDAAIAAHKEAGK